MTNGTAGSEAWGAGEAGERLGAGDVRDGAGEAWDGVGEEVWIGPRARELASLRVVRVRKLLRETVRAVGVDALADARGDARMDARSQNASAARQLDASAMMSERGSRRHAAAPAPELTEQEGPAADTTQSEPTTIADAHHLHGEALGPGAQRFCTEREKHAFGGAHPQLDFVAANAT
jgi:hypothetical protein